MSRARIVDGRKQCFNCQVWQLVGAFSMRTSPDTGLPIFQGECKPCAAKRTALHYRANREKRLAYARTKAVREQRYAQRKAVPRPIEKAEANARVQAAVRSGLLIKPMNCEDCGELVPRARLQGHHEDYSKPLEVLWLCSACHHVRHRKYDYALGALLDSEASQGGSDG